MISPPPADLATRQPAAYRPRALQDWLLAAYVTLLPIQITIGEYHLAPSDISLVIMLALAPLGIVHLKRVKSVWSLWHIGMMLMFCMGAMVALGRTGEVSLYALINKLTGMMVLFASYAMIVGQADSWPKIRWMLRLLIASVTIQNTLFVAAFILYRAIGLAVPFLNVEEPRLAGLLIDPNAYGGLLGVTLSVHLLTRYGKSPLIGGALGELATITLAMGMMLTYSRSAWIGLGLLALLVAAKKPAIALRLAFTAATALTIILLILGPGYMADISQMSSRGTHETRIQQAEMSIPLFWESPVVGIGLGVFSYQYGEIIHNTLIWILTEFGMLGFTIFCGFVIWFLQRGAGAYRLADTRAKPVVLGLIAASLAMMGLSLGIEALYQRHLWLMWALIASSYAVLSKQRAATRQVAPQKRRVN